MTTIKIIKQEYENYFKMVFRQIDDLKRDTPKEMFSLDGLSNIVSNIYMKIGSILE